MVSGTINYFTSYQCLGEDLAVQQFKLGATSPNVH